MNRDLSNGLQYGFQMGLLKFGQSGAPDCTTSGMSVFRSSIKMFKKYKDSGFNETENLINAAEFMLLFQLRCNYFTTLQGVILSRKVSWWLFQKDTSGFLGILADLWTGIEYFANIVDDGLVLS